MIYIDFSWAVALYIIFILFTLISLWVFAKKEKAKGLTLDPRYIWFCSVCTYNYINTKEDEISVCPRCGSYNKRK
jgi:predicted Zn-ribbon and HTH transcriptional regulator